jgi:hypothetical protein
MKMRALCSQPIFNTPFSKTFLDFSKMDKKNVQNRKPNLLFGKKLLLQKYPKNQRKNTRRCMVRSQKL